MEAGLAAMTYLGRLPPSGYLLPPHSLPPIKVNTINKE
jgi:hypothetical protein